MEEDKLVSVILPTYNVEKYLVRCLGSIIGQSYKNIEIIIVIDGATDNSLSIAQSYAEKDSRIHVIYQENAGSGPARNNGLRNAKGDFVVFVDPDDWIATNAIENLVLAQQEKDFDLVLCGDVDVIFKDDVEVAENIYRADELKILSKKEARQQYFDLYSKELLGAPTRKLYKMSVINNYGIEFPDLRRSQDIVFNYRYYNFVNSVCVSTCTDYFYRIEPKALIMRLKEDYYKTVLFIYTEIRKLHHEWNVELSKDILSNKFIFMVLLCLEANVIAKKNLAPIINNDEIREIVQYVSLSRIDIRLLKAAILIKSERAIALILKLRWITKKVFRHGR